MSNEQQMTELERKILRELLRKHAKASLSFGDGDALAAYRDLCDRQLLSVVMEQSRGNQSRAAIALGISRGTLRSKLKGCDFRPDCYPHTLRIVGGA